MKKHEKNKEQVSAMVTEATYCTTPKRAQSILNEIRGYIVANFGLIDSIGMDELRKASLKMIKVAAKKSTKEDVAPKKKKS